MALLNDCLLRVGHAVMFGRVGVASLRRNLYRPGQTRPNRNDRLRVPLQAERRTDRRHSPALEPAFGRTRRGPGDLSLQRRLPKFAEQALMRADHRARTRALLDSVRAAPAHRCR
jgi:hypothetical protein